MYNKMVRQSSKTATEKPTASTPAPASATPAKKTSSKKASKDVAPVSEPVVAAAPAVATEATSTPKVEVGSLAKIAELEAMLQQVGSLSAKIKGELKGLRKTVEREQKVAAKNSKSARKHNPNRKPSGFAKPTRISDELAQFLGKTVGTEMARTDVSKEISNYIKSNNLNDSTNKRIIHPDAKLSNLLKIKKGDKQLTYFNLQTFLKHHFIKATPAVTA
jgi:chromatin remodeling complex protein RSC6